MGAVDAQTSAKMAENCSTRRVLLGLTTFEMNDSRLVPRNENDDIDASYTYRAYGLGARRKTELRASRSKRLALLERSRNEMQRLVPQLNRKLLNSSNREDRVLFADTIKNLRATHKDALREAIRYAPIPTDHPPDCHCDHGPRTLPEWLRSQIQNVDITQTADPSPS